MHGSPSAEEIRAEQDRVAALVDQAAVEANGSPSAEVNKSHEPSLLPQSSSLTADALEAGVVRLATELKGPEQTSPEFVGKVLGVVLAEDSAGKWTGAQGAFGSGTYTIEVETLYPSTPGRHVSILLEPAAAKPCALNFNRFVEQLEKAGYVGKRAPRGMDPSMSFSKDLGLTRGFMQLDVDGYDAPCIWQVSFDLEAKSV